MTKELYIERTISAMNQLPKDKAQEISDFADFLIKRHEEEVLSAGIRNLTEKGESFDFLNQEEDLYSVDDLKKPY